MSEQTVPYIVNRNIRSLNVAYMTNRIDNRIEWFLQSLRKEMNASAVHVDRIIVVDFHSESCGPIETHNGHYWRVPPKPTVWQGKHRKTKQDYFAASNARNTALCYALDGYIAYVDDLSVLMPGWLARVRAAMDGGYVACGTYEKVRNLIVENGNVISCEHTTHGMDHRLIHAQKQYSKGAMPALIPHTGSWLFGCSIAGPVQAFLDINGWDEDCDSMGAEDYPCGWMLHSAGYKLFFDPAMKTLESEELHFVEPPFLRIDKQNVMGKKDASNAYLHLLNNGRKKAPNYFGPEGLAGLRQRILAGEPFPVMEIPQHDWRDGQLISEM